MKPFRIFQNASGFSLVELMFVLGISTLIGFVIFVTTRAGDQQIDSRAARMYLQDNAREGLYKMVQEIRQSSPSRITISSSGNDIQIVVPDPSSLVKSDYTLNWTSAHTITYALGGTDSKQLIRTDVTSGKTAVIANDVTDLDFSGSSAAPNVVTATMKVQKTLTNGRLMPTSPLQLTAQAEVRNN